MNKSDIDTNFDADLNRSASDDYIRALDDAATIEAKARLNKSRTAGFAVGAIAGLVITSIVLKAMGR